MAGHQIVLRLVACFCLLGCAVASARETALVARSTSASGAFVVYSADAVRRSDLVRRAEVARTVWGELVEENPESGPPIIIQDLLGRAKPRGVSGARTAVFEGDGGTLKVQIDIYDAAMLRGLMLEPEIFRALALHEIYRKHPPKSGRPFHSPPAWLVEGLAEQMRVKENGSPDGVYATLLKSERPPRLEEFLKTKPELLEATSLTLYRTQALALVEALRQLSEGRKGFSAFLESLEGRDPDMKALLAAFPSLQNDPSRLGKIWTLAIARSSTPNGIDPYSIGETIRALKGLLDISVAVNAKDPAKGEIRGAEALPALARSDGGPYLMRQKSAEFLTLEFRAHPLLRPVIEEYRKIATELAAKPKKNLAKQIEENGKILDLLLQRTGQVDDYLNWFEATQLDSLSENFLEITNPQEPPQRTDPITLHLNAIETRGW